MIVVDTSVLIDFLRGTRTAATDLFARLEEDAVSFMIPVVCFQEVLQGARDQKEWRLLNDYLGSQRLLVPDSPIDMHREAARIFFDARRKGITVRSTVDCMIAAQTLRQGATLLHDDEDFERIAAVRPLRTVRG